jgi:hypothetical protein
MTRLLQDHFQIFQYSHRLADVTIHKIVTDFIQLNGRCPLLRWKN